MLSREQLKYLFDMWQAAADIALHLGSATREEFLRNKTMTRAVEREFEILGEAARHVSEETRARLPEVAFRSAVAMRNRGKVEPRRPVRRMDDGAAELGR